MNPSVGLPAGESMARFNSEEYLLSPLEDRSLSIMGAELRGSSVLLMSVRSPGIQTMIKLLPIDDLSQVAKVSQLVRLVEELRGQHSYTSALVHMVRYVRLGTIESARDVMEDLLHRNRQGIPADVCKKIISWRARPLLTLEMERVESTLADWQDARPDEDGNRILQKKLALHGFMVQAIMQIAFLRIMMPGFALGNLSRETIGLTAESYGLSSGVQYLYAPQDSLANYISVPFVWCDGMRVVLFAQTSPAQDASQRFTTGRPDPDLEVLAQIDPWVEKVLGSVIHTEQVSGEYILERMRVDKSIEKEWGYVASKAIRVPIYSNIPPRMKPSDLRELAPPPDRVTEPFSEAPTADEITEFVESNTNYRQVFFTW